jgi:hypothetical protein
LDNSLFIALGITAIGMTLLFLALAFFYGLLSLMMVVIKDRPTHQAMLAGEQREEPDEGGELLRAVAVAVVMARAEAEQIAVLTGALATDEAGSSESVSPWWALHHQREVALGPETRRVR